MDEKKVRLSISTANGPVRRKSATNELTSEIFERVNVSEENKADVQVLPTEHPELDEEHEVEERRKTKILLGRGLTRRVSAKVILTDLDFNAPTLDYLNDIALMPQPNDGYIPRSSKVRVGFSKTALIVQENEGNNTTELVDSYLLGREYLYPIKSIKSIIEKTNEIDSKMLSQLQHLVYGSNSSICSAKLKNCGMIILKIIKERCSNPQVAEAEFEAEHHILCRMNHENIMGYYGRGTMNNRRFLCLERMDHGTLSSLLAHPGFLRSKLSLRQVLELGVSFTSALQYLHEDFSPDAMLIHRDLKPDNIAFTQNGRLKLIDFGLTACVKKKSSSNEAYAMTGNTGSLRYMAPEVCLCLPYNEKVDIYGFAIIMWHVLTGERPFEEYQTHRDFVMEVATAGARPPLEGLETKLELKQILEACWDREMSNRPSANQVKMKLSTMLEEMGLDPHHPHPGRSQSCTVS
eukprot:CAMPEP_0182439312 /NCGR_PEP_ID=MMETSP1167-20130531/86361_1 /TAXON_ID=2988 /ORGANISM="Mallomonas Sp, Strain CCMP3275" /LENGTH=463 /DNA_ID=CAMNT_0024632985 /DNA_START=119 /DNA_END=1510 /DNA_ORIENTATION=+